MKATAKQTIFKSRLVKVPDALFRALYRSNVGRNVTVTKGKRKYAGVSVEDGIDTFLVVAKSTSLVRGNLVGVDNE
jgi:hypothetical protein